MNSKKKKLYLVLLFLVTICCIFFGTLFHVIGALGNLASNIIHGDTDHDWNIFENYDYKNSDKEQLDSFSNINADMSVCDITIKTGETYAVSYKASEKMVPNFQVKDDTLQISQPEGSDVFHIGNQGCSLILTVPEDANLKDLKLTCDVGDISLNQLNISALTLDADVGDIDLNDSNIDTSIITSNIGDVDISQCSYQLMKVTSDTGDLDVEDTVQASQDSIDVSVDIGEINIDSSDSKNVDGISKSYRSTGDSGRSFTASTDTGDISIE